MHRVLYRWWLTLGLLALVVHGSVTKLQAQRRMGPQMGGAMIQSRNVMGNGFQMGMQGMRLGSGMMTNQSSSGMMSGGAMGSGSYGSGSSGYGGYGNNANDQDASQGYSLAPAYGTGAAPQSEQNVLLNAMGLPNRDGKLTWPLGLQALLPDSEVSALRDRIDAVVQVVSESVNEQLNARLAIGAKQSVSRLRYLLRTNGEDKFDTSVYKEAARFLDQLDDGLDLLR